jgi:mannose-6-phosphate isomerase-like protein (cupin superfamily)
VLKRQTIVIGAALVPIALFLGIGVALGTPGSGAMSVYPARGNVGSATQQIVLGTPRTVTITRTVRIKTKRGFVRGRVKFQVPGMQPHIACGATACDMVFQVLTIQPGGFTGWHTHPGPTFVAVAQGEGSMYRAAASGCTPTKYAAGSGFLQPSTEVHNMRNEGSTALVLHAFYLLPPGTADAAIRVDQPQAANCTNIP